MGNGWVVSPISWESCDFICSDFETGGFSVPARTAMLTSPALIAYVMDFDGSEPCTSYADVQGGNAPAVIGVDGSCRYDSTGNVNDQASASGAFQICCCRAPEDEGAGLTDAQACPLPSTCEEIGKSEAQCSTKGDECVWLGGWRTKRNSQLATLKAKLKKVGNDKKRRKKLRRRLGWTYRQYAGCAQNAGCQSPTRCVNYCRPVCAQAEGCKWSQGLGCVHEATQAPTINSDQ